MDDVVIVGGGPAGSVAAAQLAQRGVNAVLLDARQFPREKACGGGIQHRCLQFLPSDFSTVERAGCSSVRLSHGLVSTAVRDAGRPVVHCVTRWEFDHFLLEKAKSAGARVREGVRVTSVERANGFVRLQTSTGPLAARYVIAADGANSIVNQRLNPRCNFQWQTALYAEVDALKLGPSAVRSNEMRVDVNSLPSGYAWVFPKGDRVNIGAWRAEPVRQTSDQISCSVPQVRGLQDRRPPMARPSAPHDDKPDSLRQRQPVRSR